MLSPKISIVTVTYNSERTLGRTIQSVIAQNYANLEYIVVDGASTDNTLGIIKDYEAHISKWISEADDGISDAFNKGIEMATGTIIGIVNSDDGLLPGALAEIANAYEENVDVYRGKIILWKEDEAIKVEETPSMHFNYYGTNHIAHQGTFITKRAYEKYGNYDSDCKFVMDYDLLLRYQQENASFKYIDKVLAFYTLDGVSATKFTKERRLEVANILKRNGAKKTDIWLYMFVKYAKIFLKSFIKKGVLLNFFYKKANPTA